jgi:CRISPR-associated exonuclease Cas4
MDSGSWWPDGDTSAGRIPLSALEHADYFLRQAALIHVVASSPMTPP